MPQLAVLPQPNSPHPEHTTNTDLEIPAFGSKVADARRYAGHLAMHLEDSDADRSDEYFSEDWEQLHMAEAEVASGLDQARETLGLLNDRQADTLEGYMDTAPDLIRLRFDLHDGKSWQERLFEATDLQLINVLDWHTDTLRRQQQSVEFQEAVVDHKEFYESSVKQAAADGWLHTDIVAKVGDLKDTKYLVGDIFDTTFHGMGGYQYEDTDYIVLSQTDTPGKNGSMNKRLASHEVNHRFGRIGPRWINEAITEHIAASLHNGQPEIIAPVQRRDDSAGYENERQLLGIICELGNERVPVTLFTKAYFAEGDERYAMINELTEQIDRSWGKDNFLKDVSNRIAGAEREFLAAQEQGDPTLQDATSMDIQDRAAKLVITEVQSIARSIRERNRMN